MKKIKKIFLLLVFSSLITSCESDVIVNIYGFSEYNCTTDEYRILKPTQGYLRDEVRGDKTNWEMAGRAGFTILKNEGDGNVRKIAGPSIHKNKDVLKKIK